MNKDPKVATSEAETSRNPKRRRRQDIEVLSLERMSWKTPEEVSMSIGALYRYAEAHAKEATDWYLNAKRGKAWWSRSLRLGAIVLTTLGGLAPVIAAIGWFDPADSLNIGETGYLFLGLAAGCVGLDKFFGFSSGWMRYISTGLAIQKDLSSFRLDWANMVAQLGDNHPTPDQIQLMLQRIKDFVVTIDKHVEEETQAWITEFKSSLSEIAQTAKTQLEAAQPGAIDITVTNGMEATDGFAVSIDGVPVGSARGTKYQIGYVPPGPHKVAVTSKIGGRAFDASELVTVSPGAIARATLFLPYPSKKALQSPRIKPAS